MSDVDTARLRERLLELREELEASSATANESSQVVELDQARVGRLSRMDAMQAQAMSQAAGRRRHDMLNRITVTLARIDREDFGCCKSCDEVINPRRLEFDPTVTLCISCAERSE